MGETVVDLHWRILDCLEQAGVDERFEYDREEFVPHLTVGAPWVTADDSALDELRAAVELLELPPFAVAEITEFHRSGFGEPYRPLGAFKLLGPPDRTRTLRTRGEGVVPVPLSGEPTRCFGM